MTVPCRDMTLHVMAAEPTSAGTVGITALFVALLGPIAGEYSAIVFAALAGALWPLLKTGTTTTRREGAWFLFKIVLAAVILTSAATYCLEATYGFPARYGTPVVAFMIGALGSGWEPVLSTVSDGLSELVRRVLATKAADKVDPQ